MPHIYLKREDLNHTGAHKINNALGQAMLCKRMGKNRIIAETGAGQHGVATVRHTLQYGVVLQLAVVLAAVVADCGVCWWLYSSCQAVLQDAPHEFQGSAEHGKQ